MLASLHLSQLLLLLLLMISLGAFWTTASAHPSPDRIVIIARHGDRAPQYRYPWDDKYRVWKHGYGHLTKQGKLRMYRLGVHLRQRYAHLYRHQVIHPRDLYIRSSAVERCLETAQLLAAGLSPPSRSWPWNAPIGAVWQPIPVHTMPLSDDGLLVSSSMCKRAVALHGRIPEANRVKHFMIPYESILAAITNQTGVLLKTYRQARNVYDSILCAKHHLAEMDQPDVYLHKAVSWITAEQAQALKSIFEMCFQFDFTGIIEPELLRLRAGLLLTEIFNRLEPTHSAQSPKMFIYTTHDANLFYLLDALGLRRQHTLMFGATVIFESTYSTSRNETTVAMYIIEVVKSTDVFKAKELHLPLPDSKEGSAPTLAALKQFYAPLMIKDMKQWRKECKDMTGLDEEKLQRGKDEL